MLDTDPEARARLSAYSEMGERLRRALDPVLAEPVPARLLVASGGRKLNRGWIPAALAAGVLLGLAGGWFFAGPGDPAEPAVVRAALSAHAVYLPEVRHPVEVVAAQRNHLNKWLSKRLHHHLAAPDLSALGLDLVGGRLLPDAGFPAAQFMYETNAGERVTIYCRLEAADAQWALRYAEGGGRGLYHWAEGGMSYAVVAAMDRDTLKAIATAAHPQL